MSLSTTKLQSQEIYLDSQYASVNIGAETGKNSDVYFFLSTPIVVGNECDIVLQLENLVCPISFFVVSSTNQSLVVDNVTYTIPEGNYNALTLNTALSTLLTSFTITYDSTSNKFTFTKASDFTFDESSTCLKMLGFPENTTQSSSNKKLTSPFVVNLAGTSLIYIDCPNITTRNVSAKNNGGFTSIIKSIVVDVPYGSILTYVNNTNSAINLGEKYISYFHIKLLDDDYNLLDLNGQNFTMTLELLYAHNGEPPGFSGVLTDIANSQEQLTAARDRAPQTAAQTAAQSAMHRDSESR